MTRLTVGGSIPPRALNLTLRTKDGVMRIYNVRGYDKFTGERKTIQVTASTHRHAKTIAYDFLDYPVVLDRNNEK